MQTALYDVNRTQADTSLLPFSLPMEKTINEFERSVLKLWQLDHANERRAGLVGMLEAYTNAGQFEHIDEIILLLRVMPFDPAYTGPERRRAFYPLARMNIAGNLLADIALHPDRYTPDERDQRVADWNSISASAWNGGQEMLRFCEKRV